MLTILIGKTASGKTTIQELLCNNYNFQRIITYTTRPMRPGETQDYTYHFISNEEFFQKIENNDFIEHKEYHTNEGIWYYGSGRDDIIHAINSNDNYVIILTPDGIKDLLELRDKVNVIYIYCSEDCIRKRLAIRGDKQNEIERRIEHDNEDFKGVIRSVDYTIGNFSESTTPEDVVNVILNLVGG